VRLKLRQQAMDVEKLKQTTKNFSDWLQKFKAQELKYALLFGDHPPFRRAKEITESQNPPLGFQLLMSMYIKITAGDG